LASVLEMAGVGSLGPFMAVVADPSVIQRQSILTFVYQIFGFQSDLGFLVFLGIIVFVLLIFATVIKMIILYVMYRFTGNRRYSLGLRLFKQYLYQPYQFFLNHNSGNLSERLLSEVDMAINGVLGPAMDSFVRGVLIQAVLIFLVIVNPNIAVIAFGVFGVLYAVLYGFVRLRIVRYGKDVSESNLIRYKASAEAFGGIKDVKILGKEPFFAHAYGVGARRFATTQAASQILSGVPGQAMQAMAVGFAVAMVIILLGVNGTLVEILPMLAIYTFAVMRMIPNAQAFFQDMTQIRYYGHIVDALYTDMTDLLEPPVRSDTAALHDVPEVLPFTSHITLQGIKFSYPSSPKTVLKGIDLHLTKDTTIGFVGATGCGKTTLVDVIMGLLEPDTGSILVDDIPVITKDPAPWQRNFGYVPQQIYLSDDTVAANIAFGIPENMRDMTVVEQSARVANLHEFITTLPQGYNTIVGERGVRLSGGQRQRIGIARSLYHDPAILVMDEATSALDTITEDAVMDAIHNLKHSKTVIIIAHRLSTVQECDLIYLMEKGKITARGKYDDLLRTNVQFRTMAKVVVK
jgi:ABC-type bacteriocin/lantibiotic exporter with double-glycine peptidase domain